MTIAEAVRTAEMEYARLDRAQDHLAPDSEGYVELGPIVPWIERRAAELCQEPVNVVHDYWFAYGTLKTDPEEVLPSLY